MNLQAWNPHIRFARSHDTLLLQGSMQAPDHRLLYFHSNGQLEVAGIPYSITPGVLIYIPAGTAYRYLPGEETFVFSGFNFDFYQEHVHLSTPIPPTRESKFSPDAILEQQPLLQKSIPHRCLCMDNGFHLEDTILEIAAEFHNHNLYYAERCSALLKDVLIQMIRYQETAEHGVDRQKADRILRYIHTHYHLPLSNKALATQFGYHENHISKLIRTYTGLPLHQYVLNYKMHIAVSLLQSTTLSVTEVAEQVGMPDIKHFSKCFKKTIGRAPSGFQVRQVKTAD